MFTILPAVPTSVSRTLIPTWMHDILCADLCTFRHQMFSDILIPTPSPHEWALMKRPVSHQPLIGASQGHPHANSMTGALTLNICPQEKSRSNKHPEKPWKERNGKRWLQRAWWVCFHRRQPTVQWLLAISSSYYWMFNTYQAQSASPCVCVCTHAQLLNHMWLFVTPMDCSPPCSSVHGILQARILEGVAILYLHICSQLILITVLQVKYYVPWFLAEEIQFKKLSHLPKIQFKRLSHLPKITSLPCLHTSLLTMMLLPREPRIFLKHQFITSPDYPFPLFIIIQFQNLNSGKCVMHVYLVASDSVTVWTIARQAPLSTGFFKQEYWNGLPFSPPGERWGYWQRRGFKTIRLVCSEKWLWAKRGAGVQGAVSKV